MFLCLKTIKSYRFNVADISSCPKYYPVSPYKFSKRAYIKMLCWSSFEILQILIELCVTWNINYKNDQNQFKGLPKVQFEEIC